MQVTSTQLRIKTKRDDSYELSRFFLDKLIDQNVATQN